MNYVCILWLHRDSGRCKRLLPRSDETDLRTADLLVSLLFTYLVAATTCLVAIPFFGRLSLRENIAFLGWPSVLLGISICFLELGFLLAYRAGWNLSTAALACNVAVGLFLISLGLFYFKEHLTIANGVGILLAMTGLWPIGQR